MTNLLIANAFSFISAVFTVASSWTKDPRRTYWYQVGQCLLYGVAAYFFGAYATIAMMAVNAFRNCLVAAGKYSARWMVVCAASSAALGMVINGNSFAEYLSVFSTVYYTIASFYLRDARAVKINVAIDLWLWFLFDVLVGDVSSGVVDIVGGTLAVVTFVRIIRDEKKEYAEKRDPRAGLVEKGSIKGQKGVFKGEKEEI